MQHRPAQEGTFDYVVEVDQRAGEARPDNNSVTRAVAVRDETIRVLMVQAYPSYEFRFLKNVLGRETSDADRQRPNRIELTTVLQEADLEYAETDATARQDFPGQRDELLAFDVILFGDVNPALLGPSAMQNINEFVTKHGRAVVLLSGPRFTPQAYRGTPLAELIPIGLSRAEVPDPNQPITQPFVVQPTRLGRDSPHLQLADSTEDNLAQWQNLPGLYWLLRAPRIKPGVRVLAEHPELTNDQGQKLPVICLQYVGAGKVIFHATDETWRWRMGQGDRRFGRYWKQTVRFLARAKLGDNRAAELVTDRQRYRRGEAVQLRLRFFDDRQAPDGDEGVTVMVQHDAGSRRRVLLQRDSIYRGRFEGTLPDLASGRYSAWVVTPTLENGTPRYQFEVATPSSELTRQQADIVDLQRAADASGGRFYTFASSDRLITDLPAGGPVRVEPLAPEPVWNSWPIAALFVALLLAEWLLRKQAGLL